MRFSKTPLTYLKCILISVLFLSSNVCVFAQLKKTAKIEKVKSFTIGSVYLYKTTLEGAEVGAEVYYVTLRNNSSYYQPIVLYLGNKDEMIKNLHDLSDALDKGKKGEVFDFSACGKNYHLSFSRAAGQKCFKVWEPISTSDDFGRFFKSTIDDILDFMEDTDKTQNDIPAKEAQNAPLEPSIFD